MNIFSKIASLVGCVSVLVACSTPLEDVSSTQSELTEVGFELADDATRTTIDPDGKTTRWAVGDKLAVWAVNSEGGYTFEKATFTLRYFSGEFQKAYFTSNIASMNEGEYTYYLSYPEPKSVDGTKATFSIPAAQSGKYEGRYDIMVAEPVAAEALTTGKKVEFNTIMRHQMHALKITIPERDSNFANKVKSLEITFPNDVVGDVALDVTDPNGELTYSNMSNVITVHSDEGFMVGSDIWVFVLPGTVSGDVSYKITGFEQSSEVATYPFERTFERGHVTPVRMAMPPFEKYTVFNFSIGENYLGEDFDFFTLYDNNGTNMGTYYRNAENRYAWEHYGEFDVTPYNNSNWTLVFDSKNAVVENQVNMGTLKPYFKQDIAPVDVPYLLFQDFENVSESKKDGDNEYDASDRNQPGVALTGALDGWNAARYWLKPGAMRINSRYQSVKVFMSFASYHYGRMDTPPLGNDSRGLKPGASVNIKVYFDAALYKHTSSSLSLTKGEINVATHTNHSNPIDGIPTGSTGISSTYDTTLADFGTNFIKQELADNAGNEDFGKSFPTFSGDMPATSDTRLVFYPTLTTKSGTGNTEVNVYIDNIKVSIAK